MSKKIIIGLITCLGVFVFVSLGVSGIQQKKKEELYRQVRLLSDALAIIEMEYVEEVQPKDLIYGALRGMLSTLDQHSQFLDPQAYNELKADTEGKFGGLGIEITMSDGLLTVVTPIEDTPAWKAGIKPADKIIKINGELTRDMLLADAVRRLRGKPGEAVNITIWREAEKKIQEFKIVRDIIKVKDIKEARILEEGIGYIRLVEFRQNTPEDLDKELERLRQEGMNALILDLRNNPGGLLEVAVKVVEKFTEKGKLVVYIKGRKESESKQFLSCFNQPYLDLPLVVLINEGSASGSEIVAGALQDYRRAIIVGVKSFGKGSVQTVIPLSDGSGLRLTTSKYFTPNGRQISKKGIIPDISVEEGRIEFSGASKIEMKDKKEEIFEQIEEKREERDKGQEYKSDNQLMRAVDLLKAIKIYKTLNSKP